MTAFKRRPEHKEIYTKAEMRRILDCCSNRSWPGARFKMFVILCWRTGIRCDEALNIMPNDINLEECSIRIVGKGRKFRTVGFDPRTREFIKNFMLIRAKYGFGDGHYLLCSGQGRKLCPSEARRKIGRVCKHAQIGKYVHVHGLRHTAAHDMLMDGLDVRTIQRQLGHSKLEVTEVYLSRICPKELIEKVRARPSW